MHTHSYTYAHFEDARVLVETFRIPCHIEIKPHCLCPFESAHAKGKLDYTQVYCILPVQRGSCELNVAPCCEHGHVGYHWV